MQIYNINHGPTRLLVMTKPSYNAVVRSVVRNSTQTRVSPAGRATPIVFVSSRKQAKPTFAALSPPGKPLLSCSLMLMQTRGGITAATATSAQTSAQRAHFEDINRPRFLMTDEQSIKPLLEKVDDKVL